VSVENDNDQQFITAKGNNVIYEMILNSTPDLDPAYMTFVLQGERVKILYRPYHDEPVRPISLYAWGIGDDIAVQDGSGIYSTEDARKIWIHLTTECLWRAA
jgi:hypothetical protein